MIAAVLTASAFIVLVLGFGTILNWALTTYVERHDDSEWKV